MAAPEDSKTAVASLGFRRLWTALGKPDVADGRPAAGDVPLDRDAPASPADVTRTFRLLASGAEDLLGREHVAVSEPALASAGGTGSTARTAVKPLAGVVAWVVAAAAGVTFLFAPGEADAYHYFSHQGHFDHSKKEQIQMYPHNYGAPPTGGWDASPWRFWVYAVDQWNAWTTGSIKITFNPSADRYSSMTMLADYIYDESATAWGWVDIWNPGSGNHWTHGPAARLYFNTASIRAYAEANPGSMSAAQRAEEMTMSTTVHEVGHALGLAHTPANSGCSGVEWNEGIMQDNATGYTKCRFVSPQSDDTSGVNKLYTAAGK